MEKTYSLNLKEKLSKERIEEIRKKFIEKVINDINKFLDNSLSIKVEISQNNILGYNPLPDDVDLRQSSEKEGSDDDIEDFIFKLNNEILEIEKATEHIYEDDIKKASSKEEIDKIFEGISYKHKVSCLKRTANTSIYIGEDKDEEEWKKEYDELLKVYFTDDFRIEKGLPFYR